MNKYSKQREDVLEYIKNSYMHPTAEDIYTALKAQSSTISRGTVYRNLAVLVDKEVIIKIPIQNQHDRYDYIHTPHSHAICNKCGKIYDFYPTLSTAKLEKEVLSQTDVSDISNQLIVYGVCKNCKTKFKEVNYEGIKRN